MATMLSFKMQGEIISTDSRQVYKNMDIGTGKDLKEYVVEGINIPYHLIDIVNAGEEYNVFQFQRDFHKVFKAILKRNNQPILCGGTGLYIEAALRPTAYLEVPENYRLRESMYEKTLKELQAELLKLNDKQHNETDLLNRERLIRALEIETFKNSGQAVEEKSPLDEYVIFGLSCERKELRKRIEVRLDHRLKNGLIEEVEKLLNSGISHNKLLYYGLEYRYVSEYLQGNIQKNDMRNKLLQSIRQFAKKQETWFRRMQKQGYSIHWLDASKSVEDNSSIIIESIKK